MKETFWYVERLAISKRSISRSRTSSKKERAWRERRFDSRSDFLHSFVAHNRNKTGDGDRDARALDPNDLSIQQEREKKSGMFST